VPRGATEQTPRSPPRASPAPRRGGKRGGGLPLGEEGGGGGYWLVLVELEALGTGSWESGELGAPGCGGPRPGSALPLPLLLLHCCCCCCYYHTPHPHPGGGGCCGCGCGWRLGPPRGGCGCGLRAASGQDSMATPGPGKFRGGRKHRPTGPGPAVVKRGYHCRGLSLSREQCVLLLVSVLPSLVSCLLSESEGRGCHTQYPLEVGAEVYR
jgi:hypothetical protein